jgi:hypothetical protein
MSPNVAFPVLRTSCAGSGLLLLLTLLVVPHLNGQFAEGDLFAVDRLSYLPPLGGPGGGQFKSPCDPGEYLHGVYLRAADDVDAVGPICATPDGIPTPNTAPLSGGPGGKPVELHCPPNAPAVIALTVLAEGAETVVVNNVHLYCGLPIPNQATPAYPSAVFDGPAAVSSQPLLPGVTIGGAPIRTAGNFQACPAGQIATGVNGRSGKWLDAMGLICGPPPVAPGVKSIGRVNAPSSLLAGQAPGSICDSAASARARNSPAAKSLEIQCTNFKAQITVNERQDLTPGASGVPVSVCDAAQSALTRNAPEAADLATKCRAIGGGQNLLSQADQFAAAGAAIASGDPLLTELRNRQPAGPIRQGFDIGTAVVGSQTAWGPGKQKVMDSLKPAEQEGFKVATSFALDRNVNAPLAAIGASIAASDPSVAQPRTQDNDVRYWLGFDIASGLFGDLALGAAGHTSTGPGSDKIQNALSPPAQRGFAASVRFHLSRKY